MKKGRSCGKNKNARFVKKLFDSILNYAKIKRQEDLSQKAYKIKTNHSAIG